MSSAIYDHQLDGVEEEEYDEEPTPAHYMLHQGTRATGPAKGEINVTPDLHDFELVVVQHPVRARMCGFGDRDRRPLTPPLLVKVVVKDRVTGAVVPADIINITFFILSVDLWAADKSAEANLVIHPSVAVPAQRRQTAAPQLVSGENTVITSAPQIDHYLLDTSAGEVGDNVRLAPMRDNEPRPGPSRQRPYQNLQTPANFDQPAISNQPMVGVLQKDPSDTMAIRNLVGALQASPSRLKDLEGEVGIFFAFVDLSVRTEGKFRLRMVLTDLSRQFGDPQPRAAILAEVFTESFDVLTAKKFPGMMDPTILSQCFAKQGLRIPTRTTKRDDVGPDEDEDLG